MSGNSDTESNYTEIMAKSTFLHAKNAGESILWLHDDVRLIVSPGDYLTKFNERLREEQSKFVPSSWQDGHNYNEAQKLIKETAQKIAEALYACNAHAGTNDGSLTGQWPPFVYALYNQWMSNIRRDFDAKFLNILEASKASEGNGPLIWDSVPEKPPISEIPDSTPSPIILDLDGDGVETVKREDGVYFDHGGNRFAEKTGWAGSDDAFLVYDRNNNGRIDDGGELFGNTTTLSNGRKAINGFEAWV